MAKTKAKTPEVPARASVAVVSVESLVLDAGNVRKRGEKARGALGASLRQFGPARSIVLDGQDIVRAGNGTLEAAMEAGITEVLVVEPKPGQLVAVKRSDWSAVEATSYAVADNRIAELAEWDEPGLARTLESLRSADADLAAIGFSDDEADALLAKLGDDFLDEASGAKPDGAAPPDDFREYGEDIETNCTCPKCGYRWSKTP
jgi:hypothetical protein